MSLHSDVDQRGPLKQPEVFKLRDIFGLNTVDTGKKRSWYQILITSLVHPFNVLLTILAITSGATEEYKTMGIMLIMVLLSTVLRFHQEWKSEVAAESLLKFVATKVLVIRNDPVQCRDGEMSIPSTELVPGDWVKLFPGDLIPADLILLEGKDFHVSQAALTGEAIPIQKFLHSKDSRHPTSGINGHNTSNEKNGHFNSTESMTASTTCVIQKSKKGQLPTSNKSNSSFVRFFRSLFGMPVYSEENTDPEFGQMESDLDRPELCFMGSAVVSGTALCRVIHTGPRTHFGKMATELAKRRPQNAFQLGVRRISWIFFLTMLFLIPPVLLLQGFLHHDWYEAFIFTLSVAVGKYHHKIL